MSIQNDDRYPILTQLISDVNDVLHQETHTHDNKSVLDGITQENVDKWNSGTGGTIDLSTYQQKTDNTLNTTSKEVVGAINENKSSLDNIQNQVDEHIQNHSGGGGGLSKLPYQANAKIPLEIPSKNNDYKNQYTHPSVYAFDSPWNGYKYWLAVTPYPNIKQDLENPHIVASNDMIYWKEPNADVNPLDRPDSTNNYLSDTHLVFNSTLNRLECWYRGVNETLKQENIYRRYTSDGITWSDRELLYQSTPGLTLAKLVCPIIKFENGLYRIWVSVDRKLHYYESANGYDWQFIRNLNISIWHFDILKTGKGYELFDCDGGNWSLYHWISEDNITYSKTGLLMGLGQSGSFDDYRLYKPSALFENGQYYVFYGGWSKNSIYHSTVGECKIGFSRTFDGNLQNLVGLEYGLYTTNTPSYFKELIVKESIKADNVSTNNLSVSAGVSVTSLQTNLVKSKTNTLLSGNSSEMNLFIDNNLSDIYVRTAGKVDKKLALFSHGVTTARPSTYDNYNFFYDYSLKKLLIYINGNWFDMMGNTVSSSVSVTGVTLNSQSETLSVNSTFQLTATVVPSDATNKNVTWSSSDTNVATVSNTGLVTAKANGNATIDVTTVDGNKTSTCNITVTTSNISVTGITLNSSNIDVAIGGTATLVPTISPSSATNKNVTWTSSNSSIADVSSVGYVTAYAQGSTTITVTTEDSGFTATCVVNVVTLPPNLYDKNAKIDDRYSTFPALLEGVYCNLQGGYVTTNSNGWITNKALGQFITVEPSAWYTIKVKVKDDSLSKKYYLVFYENYSTNINIYNSDKTTPSKNKSGDTYSEITYKLQTSATATSILATFGQVSTETNPITYETIYFGKE